ncbi:pyruvate dehydrogenase (acetyl-transferring) E1 component subunit alpha [Marispirochaeta sp.]|uniref:pyruvate dehydrogenase (acetyl-transferring) E1 component subunit alpha n=1 Tax=Marispirochaeta sp. TaxID=2038653 RepID=UPI0029C878CC|nr:pyruvate dehydrogenase (acetyl-transferring) E1 component subunit alpha [Marispirochaeta sp.]
MSLVKKYGKETTLSLLRNMLLMRRFEEKAGQMYGLRKIGGFCHLYIGQEAVAAGTIGALDLKSDYVIGAYRDHGHALSVGMDPKVIMAELYGKSTGCSKGKGGSMHMYSAEKHMLGGNGIVGSQIPVGTGVAWKIKYLEEKGVVLCYFGDGAIHQGAFHESLNLAKIHNLPIIYIVENNQYGMGTDFKRVSAVHDLARMGYAYDIPGKQLNGMQVMEVYDEFVNAVKSIREKPHPLFYEIKTYRYRGHSMSDPAKYRTPEELEEYKQQDPIPILLKEMQEEKLITEKEYKKMDDEIKAICDESVDFAEKSPEPELSALYEDVFAEA